MFAEWEREEIILGQHLGETNVVCNERGDDTDRSARLAKISTALEIGYSNVQDMDVSVNAANTEVYMLTDSKEHKSESQTEEEHAQRNRLAERGNAGKEKENE